MDLSRRPAACWACAHGSLVRAERRCAAAPRRAIARRTRHGGHGRARAAAVRGGFRGAGDRHLGRGRRHRGACPDARSASLSLHNSRWRTGA
ncbi:MAG: hypothetical protein MZW92_06950 [Comamonadaceae bacterium]|nr:hypothetical protein [Comamonadaceae bacterium]